jgi:hypothetical protein
MMVRYRFTPSHSSIIATIVIHARAMMAAQSSISSASAIDKAATLHVWIFGIYVGVLLLAAILSYLVWRSGNTLQDAIRLDAGARISEAVTRAAEAHRRVADAEKGAAEALARAAEANQRAATLELEAAIQREHAAKAEKELQDLRGRFTDWRTITPERESTMVAWLLPFAGEAVSVLALPGDDESRRFAEKITDVFKKAGLVAEFVVARDRRQSIGGMQLDAGQNKTNLANRIAGALLSPTPLGKLTRGGAALPDMVELMVWPKSPDE